MDLWKYIKGGRKVGKIVMDIARSERIVEFRHLIDRQRVHPRIWDFSYLVLRKNRSMFDQFRAGVVGKRSSIGRKLRILDVGCGFKPWRKLFDKDACLYVGVDYDGEKSSADSIATNDRLPFASDSFDALIYSEVLEHTEQLRDADQGDAPGSEMRDPGIHLVSIRLPRAWSAS